MSSTQASPAKRQFQKRLTEARVGDPQAQVDVGIMLANGEGARRNPKEALVWFQAAAGRGHPTAQYLVAIAHANGLGTDRDEFQAFQWFLKAADQGNEKALLKLAQRVAEHHDAFAFQCCLKAAAGGLADAQFEVAEHYALGIGVAADTALARDWYERAARQGVTRAQYALARLLEHDTAGRRDEARRWYGAAAALGHPGARLALDRLDDPGRPSALDTLDDTGDLAAASPGDDRRQARPEDADDADTRRQAGERYARFAENGDAVDRYHLGCLYELGIDVALDPAEARRWYRLAAEQHHPEAQLALARLCAADAQGTDDALHWWRQAAQLGSAHAQFELGRHHAATGSPQHDPLQALAWQLRAAEQGHPDALMALHGLLSGGAAEAADACLRRAAEQGHAEAQFAMGERYAAGAEGVDRSPAQAHDWLERAARQGHADAQCALGDWYAAAHGAPDFVDDGALGDWRAAGHGAAPDLVQARDWYEQAAQQGHTKAQWLLGALYATGAPGVPRDARRATTWCKKAASAGFAPAQATLGTLFAQAKKMERAVPWWSKAAVQGDAEAQFNLANAYRAGQGVAADPRTAFLLWTKAAAAGVPAAQTRLGFAYATGEGAAVDPVEATKWFLVAQRAGDATAVANCEHARTLLSPVQLAEAEWRAEEWLAAAEARSRAAGPAGVRTGAQLGRVPASIPGL